MAIATVNAALPANGSLTEGANGVVAEFQAAKSKLNELIGVSNALELFTAQSISNPSPGSLSFLLGEFRVTCLNYSFNITNGVAVSVLISYPIPYSVHPRFLYMTPLTTVSTTFGLPVLAIADDPTGLTGTQCIVTSATTPSVSAFVTYSLLIIGLK